MYQNLKVDIVYYRTNTDFELEFNLCGCCRMRLLTDKAPDRKTLVHDLARAVSRSRIIIISGNLFGEDGIMEITARAISKTLTEIDNNRYGISGGEKIKILNGATPLVTADGSFGGCIIESGPQSMILLTDNRAVRKTVMNTLIHPYIEELCAIEMKEKAQNSGQPYAAPPADTVLPENSVPNTSEAEEAQAAEAEEAEITADDAKDTAIADNENNAEAEISESDKKNDVPVSDAAEENEAPAAMPLDSFIQKRTGGADVSDIPMEPQEPSVINDGAADTENNELFIDTAKIKKNRASGINSTDEYEDVHYYSDGSEPDRRRTGNIAVLVISVLLLIIIAVLCYCIFYVPAKDGVSAAAYLRETFDVLFG